MLLGPTDGGSRTYRIPDIAVANLIDRLWTEGECKDLDAEAGVLLDPPAARLPDKPGLIALRMRLSRDFAEISVESGPGEGERLSIAAAGPVEELLRTLGFQPIGRFATLRYVFTLDGLQVELIHAELIGWSCELTFDRASLEAVRVIERRLGLEAYAPEVGAAKSYPP